ncbi:Domain of unknown function DUF1905 [Xylanimonas cellulosilytica DSM 15894]|uniref:DUF1905 domain-containing protein n=1 Tax=Xylanimonas cellulosilytica (strain DSM 15894 / JCM 12276 / CECT 5975 / KCTC 9989 / LMG 20990 / NBRC 107835 / XIL07) TaxID=446471 RepID=D1BXK1_XYLCX|nr:DUF1905 domain-containing protein [Xylanimonas cellulosilytica]ACZ29811.1 Domain of unknown function DUF1905 [Xylanimonas cellulosilytica DSM 15894]
MQLRFTAQLWQWQVRTDSWWFVTVPPDLSDELAELPLPPRGFGSIKVRVTIGSTRWETSVFPSDERKAYVLPVKKAVRAAEGIADGGTVDVMLEPVR